MKYNDIPDQMILNYELLKIAIFEETKYLFEDRPYIIESWLKEAYQTTDEERIKQSPTDSMTPSFRALFFLFTQTLYSKTHISKHLIRDAVNKYKDTIKILLAGHFQNEFPDDEIKRSMNEEKINEALNQDFIYSSMDIDYHLMRDIVTKKKDFKENETGLLTTEIIDNRGKVRGLAELRPYELQVTDFSTEHQHMWLELIESTINSLDEMTADLFDLITYLWIVSPKNSDGYIEFHSNDALRLRNLKKRTANGRELDFREEDRFNIMKRVAALSSIWVSLGDKKVKVINAEEMQDNELYKFKDFQRMFEVGKVRVAYDKKTGEAKGIYAVQVKPTSILTPYLVGPNRSIGLLDIKVFQYSHYTQREQKRLTRYLNLQWKIRVLKRTLQQPFKVSTLLKVMDFSSRYNGVQIRDKFENILDELQKDEVIRIWRYTEEISEERVGKKGWFNNYWTNQSVIILPTELVIKENQRNLLDYTNQSANGKIMERIHKDLTSVKEPEQQEFNFDMDQKIIPSPETLKEMIDSQNISIRQAATEMNIAHTTLSRYIKGENKRQSRNTDNKLVTWLTEKIKTINNHN
jgi:hypothetical protein